LLQDCEAHKCSGEELNFSALKTSFLRSGQSGGEIVVWPLSGDAPSGTEAIRLPTNAIFVLTLNARSVI
jgi:hypothetical protein